MQSHNKVATTGQSPRRFRVSGIFFACTIFMAIGAVATPAYAQTVAIQNVSYPGTALEVGETVGISISGASPSSPVTVSINGTLYSVGTTDGSGHWSTTSSIPDGDADTEWTEIWYVNGTAVSPSNSTLPFAPMLPTFDYYGNYSGDNCAAPLSGSAASGCGSNAPTHWIFTPVGWYSVSDQLSGDDVNFDVGLWNDVQSKISMTPADTWAIYIYDGTLDDDTTVRLMTTSRLASSMIADSWVNVLVAAI